MVACPSEEGLARELDHAGIPIRVIPHGAWRKIGGRATAVVRQIPALRAAVQAFRPDIVHANEFHSTPAAVYSAQCRTRTKTAQPVVTSHVRLTITPRQVRNYHLARATRIAAVSEACKNLFDGTGLEERVRVIYNGVDVSHLADAESERGLRAQFGWNDEDLVTGLFGLVSPRKNQRVAVEAVAAARKRGAPVHLLLAGDAFRATVEYGEELRKRIEADDVRDAVQWLPFQKDVRPLYGAIDLNLLISSEEGFGRTIIEAGAIGKPSVGARTGGIPELIADRKSGWLIEEGSVEALADVLVEACQQRETLRRMGESAREAVRERFTIEAHVEGMIAFWQGALEAAGR